jgi:ribosomal protein L23
MIEVFTEKSTNLKTIGIHSFFVDRTATKSQIRVMISSKYGVLPIWINIVKYQKVRTSRLSKRPIISTIKKAYVKLPDNAKVIS